MEFGCAFPVLGRLTSLFSSIGNLRLASQHQPNPPNLQKMIEIALRFEKELFDTMPNKVRREGGARRSNSLISIGFIQARS